MSAAAIIQRPEDGLSLAVTERDTIKVIGPRVAANRWAPALVANKPAILAELRQTGAPALARAPHQAREAVRFGSRSRALPGRLAIVAIPVSCLETYRTPLG
jgi:hypothetical protein